MSVEFVSINSLDEFNSEKVFQMCRFPHDYLPRHQASGCGHDRDRDRFEKRDLCSFLSTELSI